LHFIYRGVVVLDVADVDEFVRVAAAFNLDFGERKRKHDDDEEEEAQVRNCFLKINRLIVDLTTRKLKQGDQTWQIFANSDVLILGKFYKNANSVVTPR
jgi:hypothetical protein